MKFDASDFMSKSETFTQRELPAIKRKMLDLLADEAVIDSFDRCPYDKKNLRTTIRKEPVSGRESEVIHISAGGVWGLGNPPCFVDYAIFVHEGTSKMLPRPFLLLGARDAVQRFDWGRVGALSYF